MKKYIVKKWINGNEISEWIFPERKWALDFYKRKKNQLKDERKNEDKIKKLEDEDEFAYTWYDVENEWEGLRKSIKWREVKEERRKK